MMMPLTEEGGKVDGLKTVTSFGSLVCGTWRVKNVSVKNYAELFYGVVV